jgi:hypothetical protein
MWCFMSLPNAYSDWGQSMSDIILMNLFKDHCITEIGTQEPHKVSEYTVY